MSLKSLILAGACAFALPLAPTPVLAQDDPVDARAIAVLSEMGAYLGGADTLILEVDDSIDKQGDDGILRTFHHRRIVTIDRPDRLHVEVTGDLDDERIVFDGERVVVDLGEVYAETPAADTIDASLDLLRDQYGLMRPLMEFAYSNSADRTRDLLRRAEHLGMSTVDGVLAHHLALGARPEVDWQLWVAAQGDPRPVKVMVRYRSFPGEPRYTAHFRAVRLNAPIEDDAFRFTPAAGAARIPFEPRGEAAP